MTSQYEPGTPPSEGEPFTIDLNGCARCDGDGHEQLLFLPLTYPLEVSLGEVTVTMTHWAPCPENGEPIMLTFHANRAT